MLDAFKDAHGLVHRFGYGYPAPWRGFCGLRWQPLPDGRVLVVAYEHPENPGRSITNAAELVFDNYLHASETPAHRVVWVEAYPADDDTGHTSMDYDRCDFDLQPDQVIPTWSPMSADQWQTLGTPPPPVPDLI